MGLFSKHGGFNKLFKNVDKAIEKIGTNVGEFINDVTGVTSSARQQYEYNKNLQQEAQNFNASQAEIERNWQTEMSNTARQRGVQDAMSAGMNPILAVSEGGATSGAGAAATSPGASTGAGVGVNPISMITDLINASNTTAKTNADINNQTNLTNAEVLKILTENGYTEEKIKNAVEERNYIIQSIKTAKSQEAKNKAEAELKQWEADHALLIQVMPAIAGIAGGIIGGAVGQPLGGAVGGLLGTSARKIGFRPN